MSSLFSRKPSPSPTEEFGQSDDEELQKLKDETEGELEDDFLEEMAIRKTARGSTTSITKEQLLATVSSDAESSEATPVGGNGWNEKQNGSPELPQEYWQVQRLVKYMKAGNQTATILALSALKDFDLNEEIIQKGIRDSGGLEVLLNILETDEGRCKVASLQVIKDITYNNEISRAVFNMRGLETLVECLKEPSKDIRLLTATTISNVCKLRKARRAMRMSDGINRLVGMLGSKDKDWKLARSAALALWSLARSTKNKETIRQAGAIPMLSKLMISDEVELVIPVVGILQECASEPTFREAIRTQGLLQQFVFGLTSDNAELVQFCAKAIYECAEDEESREIVYHLGAVEPLLRIIQNVELRQNKPLLAAATGAIWKCSDSIFRPDMDSSTSSITEGQTGHLMLSSPRGSGGEMTAEGIITLLVSLLTGQPDEVLINVAGSLYQIAKADLETNAPIIKKAGAIPPLVTLLTKTCMELLVNATKAVGELAKDNEARMELENLDGFRLVWSLLKHPSPLVQSSAAWTISPYLEKSPDAGFKVRNYVGGLEAIVQLLSSPDVNVQAGVAYAVSCIARNIENLSIMSDHAVVEQLSKLAPTPRTEDDVLKQCLAMAIAHCSRWGDNSKEFGVRHAVGPVCSYLISENPDVQRATAKALFYLSCDSPRNCLTIHQCGVVPLLINLSGSGDEELRISVAGIMANIRRLALCAESVRLV